MTSEQIREHNTAHKKRDKAHDDALLEFSMFNVQAQQLEMALGIRERWRKGDADRLRVEKMISEREYDKATDKLEGLLVARTMELRKLNLAGTGELKMSSEHTRLISV